MIKEIYVDDNDKGILFKSAIDNLGKFKDIAWNKKYKCYIIKIPFVTNPDEIASSLKGSFCKVHERVSTLSGTGYIDLIGDKFNINNYRKIKLYGEFTNPVWDLTLSLKVPIEYD